MKNNLHPVLSVRLFTDQKCFGPGVAALLHGVEELHSLRAAAGAMEMAYSKAWTVVKRAEQSLGFPLLQSSAGGRNGGGAVLTSEGRRILEAYDDYCTALRDQAEALFREKFAFLED